MKSVVSVLVLMGLLCVQTVAQTNTGEQAILKSALEANLLKKVFASDENGELLPISVVSNNLITSVFKLEINGKPVEIIKDLTLENNAGKPVVEIQQFEIKSNRKALLAFVYDEKRVRLKLKKSDGNWLVYSTTVKGPGVFLTDIEF